MRKRKRIVPPLSVQNAVLLASINRESPGSAEAFLQLQLTFNEPAHQQQNAEESKNLHRRSSKTHVKAVLWVQKAVFMRRHIVRAKGLFVTTTPTLARFRPDKYAIFRC